MKPTVSQLSGEEESGYVAAKEMTMLAPYAPANASTVTNVLRRYADWLDKQEVDCNVAHAEAVNAFLDELLRGDAFGTEGQCDPRGDHRE